MIFIDAIRKCCAYVILSGALTGTVCAQPSLKITSLTWNVIGLDSNKVSEGPNTFVVGARVENTGDATATNVVSNFVWDTTNSYINVSGSSTLSESSLPSGEYVDCYYNVVVTRDSNAYDTVRGYHITATADGLGTVSTPTPRELYVEHLISQNRNTVNNITGPTTVYVGQTYQYILDSSTTPNGYNQLESFLDFPNSIFKVTSTDVTYTSPPGATNDKPYANACGWDNDPTSPTYRSCTGPCNYTDCKAGGEILTTYTVEIISTGSTTVNGLIYDFSGSSFHYNKDFGTVFLPITALEAPTPTPTDIPAQTPTNTPTGTPTQQPTDIPTDSPTESPTGTPTETPTPTSTPTLTGFCLDAQHDSLDSAGAATSSTSLVNAGLEVTVNLPSDGEIAAFFSADSEAFMGGAQTGTWDLRIDNTASSQPVKQYINGVNAQCVIGAVNIFSGLGNGSHTVRLRHATDNPLGTIRTYNADLVAFPLVTEDANASFNYGMDTLDSTGDTTNSSTLEDIDGFSATVTLDVSGHIFVAAALDAESADVQSIGKIGTWRLQVDNRTVGRQVSRWFEGSSDLGAVLLTGLSDGLPAGTYTVKVQHATDTGTLRTLNATLAAIALSDDGDGGLTITASEVTCSSQEGTTSTGLTDIDSSRLTLSLADGCPLFSSSSFNIEKGTGIGLPTAFLNMAIDGAPATRTISYSVESADDLGAGGLFGLSDSFPLGSHTGCIRHATNDGTRQILTGDITFVMMGICAKQTAPTSTPTISPTVTPTPSAIPAPFPAQTPTPTPDISCNCRNFNIELSTQKAYPGEEIVISACIPPVTDQPVDIYCIIETPGRDIRYISNDGSALKRMLPYYKGYLSPGCRCTSLLTHTVCEDAMSGDYIAALAIVPSSVPASRRNVIDFKWDVVRITRLEKRGSVTYK
jgi:hypothetical protein